MTLIAHNTLSLSPQNKFDTPTEYHLHQRLLMIYLS
jgi:hypothetical protein